MAISHDQISRHVDLTQCAREIALTEGNVIAGKTVQDLGESVCRAFLTCQVQDCPGEVELIGRVTEANLLSSQLDVSPDSVQTATFVCRLLNKRNV